MEPKKRWSLQQRCVSFILYYLRLHMFSCISLVQLFVTLWAIAHQAFLSMEFSWQEYWSGLPCHSPRDLRPRDQTCVSSSAGGFFTVWALICITCTTKLDANLNTECWPRPGKPLSLHTEKWNNCICKYWDSARYRKPKETHSYGRNWRHN